MESARLIRMRKWGGWGSARGLVLGREFWRLLKMQCGGGVWGDQWLLGETAKLVYDLVVSYQLYSRATQLLVRLSLIDLSVRSE